MRKQSWEFMIYFISMKYHQTSLNDCASITCGSKITLVREHSVPLNTSGRIIYYKLWDTLMWPPINLRADAESAAHSAWCQRCVESGPRAFGVWCWSPPYAKSGADLCMNTLHSSLSHTHTHTLSLPLLNSPFTPFPVLHPLGFPASSKNSLRSGLGSAVRLTVRAAVKLICVY